MRVSKLVTLVLLPALFGCAKHESKQSAAASPPKADARVSARAARACFASLCPADLMTKGAPRSAEHEARIPRDLNERIRPLLRARVARAAADVAHGQLIDTLSTVDLSRARISDDAKVIGNLMFALAATGIAEAHVRSGKAGEALTLDRMPLEVALRTAGYDDATARALPPALELAMRSEAYQIWNMAESASLSYLHGLSTTVRPFEQWLSELYAEKNKLEDAVDQRFPLKAKRVSGLRARVAAGYKLTDADSETVFREAGIAFMLEDALNVGEFRRALLDVPRDWAGDARRALAKLKSERPTDLSTENVQAHCEAKFEAKARSFPTTDETAAYDRRLRTVVLPAAHAVLREAGYEESITRLGKITFGYPVVYESALDQLIAELAQNLVTDAEVTQRKTEMRNRVRLGDQDALGYALVYAQLSLTNPSVLGGVREDCDDVTPTAVRDTAYTAGARPWLAVSWQALLPGRSDSVIVHELGHFAEAAYGANPPERMRTQATCLARRHEGLGEDGRRFAGEDFADLFAREVTKRLGDHRSNLACAYASADADDPASLTLTAPPRAIHSANLFRLISDASYADARPPAQCGAVVTNAGAHQFGESCW